MKRYTGKLVIPFTAKVRSLSDRRLRKIADQARLSDWRRTLGSARPCSDRCPAPRQEGKAMSALDPKMVIRTEKGLFAGCGSPTVVRCIAIPEPRSFTTGAQTMSKPR